MKKVLVLDFGGQYNLLVARRVRECGVYCEIKSYRISMDEVRAFAPDALIFTGGPATVFEPNAPMVDKALFELGVPVLGICYGQQLMMHLLGGQCRKAETREYGKIQLTHDASPLFEGVPETSVCWMSHGVEVEQLAPDFAAIAHTDGCLHAAVCCAEKNLYGVQFHPEVLHTQYGKDILQNFLYRICGFRPEWSMASYLEDAVAECRRQIGSGRVLLALSGGVDSSVAAALLADLQCGGGDVFMYENGSGPLEISAWPLPPARLAKLGGAWTESVWDDPLAALALAGERDVYGRVGEKARQEAARPHEAEVRRLSRLLEKLEREEARLNGMRDRQKDALLLQSQLYRFDAREKRESVTLESPEGPVTISLDKKRTIRENMMDLFHQAGRGRRGLEHLAGRREAVRQEKARAEADMLRSLAAVNGASVPVNAPQVSRQPSKKVPSDLPKQVQAFRSSDGFLILRGRDTKGNALVLKLAAPHDYWMHTAEGPSAHVIVRRDHASQEVPERTMLEAGALAGLKSWQKDQESAQIQYSLAKFIHPMKKAAPGMVRIDRSEGSFRVPLDPGLENKLETC